MSIRLLMAARVIAEEWPAPGVRGLEFAPVHRESFPPFVPGDHIQIQHDNGTRRDYSLIGPAADPSTYKIAIRRDDAGRGGSMLFHDELAVGDLVFVSYPQAGMRVADDTGHHLFIAGGIGVTAILGLLDGLAPGATAEVHYCVKTRADAAYLPALQASGASVTVYESRAGHRLDAAQLLATVRPDTTAYHCGPTSLMDAVKLAAAHWPADRVRSESFAVSRKPNRARASRSMRGSCSRNGSSTCPNTRRCCRRCCAKMCRSTTRARAAPAAVAS